MHCRKLRIATPRLKPIYSDKAVFSSNSLLGRTGNFINLIRELELSSNKIPNIENHRGFVSAEVTDRPYSPQAHLV